MREVVVNVGNIKIGKGFPTVIQTMCNCDTCDIEAAVSQCRELALEGADMVRLTTQGIKEVEALKIIKERLLDEGISVPLIADVHFSSKVAMAAALVADKVRINPGNFAPDFERAKKEFKELIRLCKQNGKAIRIGVNHGSLGNRITELYGNAPKAMVESMKEWVEMCLDEDFYNIVLSLKASNTVLMTEAYRQVYEWMKEKEILFPLHLGVTEAGNGDMGRIKSAVGIATLLSKGIGDTIRVSLTENPKNEISVARHIAERCASPQKCSSIVGKKGEHHFVSGSFQEFILDASCMFGPLLLEREIDDFNISCICAGKQLELSVIEDFKNNLLQASRRLFTKCEYVACPGCGRTLYDLEKTFNEVKRRTSQLKGLSIAVMGCIVNGPGEMGDADYGYVGEGHSKVAIYRGKEAVFHSVPQEKAIDVLLELIKSDLHTV